jgi:hypothetical protein
VGGDGSCGSQQALSLESRGGRLIEEASAFNDSGRVVRNEPAGLALGLLEAEISGESFSNIRERLFGSLSAAVSGVKLSSAG